jgi:prepilin-type N-terminal cleavage/methylation domain-containing protein
VKTKLTNRKHGSGFTLVEMLVVILIVGILAGLISATAMRALRRAKVARITVEIHQLDMALDQYKRQFGEYPPDFSDLSDDGKSMIMRHIAKAFPRLVLTGNTVALQWQSLRDEIYNTTNPHVDLNILVTNNNLNPSTALRFWLGGMPDAQNKPIGFSKDPAHPFDNTTPSRIGPFYDFDPGRLPLSPATELGKYYAPGIIPGNGQPYIYLRAEQGQPEPKREYYSYDPSNTTTPYTFKQGSSGAKPYWDQRNMGWVNPTSFQILCCGLDGKFSQENVYPTGLLPDWTSISSSVPADVLTDLQKNVMGTNSTTPTPFPAGNSDHLDDQTNFTTGTIGDDIP